MNPAKICLLGLRHLSMSMHDAATVHHWTKSSDSASDYHINQAHSDFAEMAEVLGYDITPKDPQNE